MWLRGGGWLSLYQGWLSLYQVNVAKNTLMFYSGTSLNMSVENEEKNDK